MRITGYESLELLFSKSRDEYCQASFEKSPAMPLIVANTTTENIISIVPNNKKTNFKSLYFNENEILKNTDLVAKMKSKNVTAFMPGTHSSAYKEKMANTHKFKLIVAPWKIQRKLENKIFFDEFLTKNSLPKPISWILRSDKDLNLIKKFPVVLQSPNSNGSQGTFFLQSMSEVKKTIGTKKLKYPLLCREYINGAPFGITMILSKEKMIFSAVRLQVFFLNKDGTNRYYGTQWVEKSELPKKSVKQIESNLAKIGRILQKQGFQGIANFDFMIKNGEMFFIECNPRLAGPTPQISNKKELLHNLNFAEEFIKSLTGKPLSANKPSIPETKYKGCTIDMDFFKPAWVNLSTKNAIQVGFYKSINGKLEYISNMIQDFNKKDSIFIYHYLLPDTRITKNRSIGFVFMHRPLAKIQGDKYSFTSEGRKILKQLECIIGKKS